MRLESGKQVEWGSLSARSWDPRSQRASTNEVRLWVAVVLALRARDSEAQGEARLQPFSFQHFSFSVFQHFKSGFAASCPRWFDLA